ncbi:MAG: ATP-binding protein [Verrucomicrobia bacterium]|nr:ATP-binding protein [Verrucomicrobiota bacterium]MCH8525595.1 ATP-binding protein [Kiritimatiellia bacterium]
MSASLPRKKLPVGIQNFREIREGDYYYVDKTPFVCRLHDEGKYYFLSRPRRFGKSLLVDTMKELFEGNNSLFKGLHAEKHWDWSKKHPVLRFSFGEGVRESQEHLQQDIREQVLEHAQRLGVDARTLDGGEPSLRRLAIAAHAKFGRRVVILVDEYDKPILDYIENEELARGMRDTLSLFYSAMKELDAVLEFVLLTGVSKFSKVNLFSKLNNLTDITLDRQFSAICGYTEADVDTVFAPEVADVDRQKMRRWYNGYNWTGEAVYNPFDALLFFRSREYRAYWYETGNPSFLLKVLRKRPVFLPDLTRRHATYALLSTFEVDRMTIEALLFQTGYLTIREEVLQGEMTSYRLGYPNQEVESSLTAALMLDWTPDIAEASQRTPKVYDLLYANDLDGLRELLTGFYASIPHQWYTKNPIAQYEGYYASVFYAFFASLGLDIRVEESSNAGRLDMAVLMENRAYIFEFKLVENGPEGKALGQILDKGYAEPHRAAEREVRCVGIEFSKAKRNIVGWDAIDVCEVKS